MNAATETAAVEQPQLPVEASNSSASAMSIIMDGDAMNRMMTAAKLMASAKVTIPKHLQGSEGDCMAVIMQAAQWKMNPFAVAQKTHISQSGTLGYEAQLVNAVVVSSGSIVGQPEFTFFGDWSKILGKVKEMRGQNGGKYYVSDWDAKLEEGLGVTVTATLSGESSPRQIDVLLTQCWPRFSTQWATDPQQQITYAAVRKFGRRYCPGAILGVYTIDELDGDIVREEKDVTPKPNRQNGADVAAQAQAAAAANADGAERTALIEKMEAVAKDYGITAYAEEWSKLTPKQRKTIGTDEHERMKKVAESIPSTATTVAEDPQGDGALNA